MANDPSSEVNIDLGLGTNPGARDESRRVEAQIFRLAICGDFTADAAAETPRHWRVDRDDFDDVLAAAAPMLHLDLGAGLVVDVRIRDIDDFHPDQLFDRVPQFAQLRAMRARLADPATFRRTASALSSPTPPSEPPPSAAAAGSLLDSIVGAETTTAGVTGLDDSLHDFIQRAMAPHLVDRPDPRQGELVAQADAAITAVMRSLLHHPRFQALESLWRGVYRLVRAVDTNERLQVHLFDVDRDTLRADLAGATSARDTRLYRQLFAGEQAGWGVLVTNHMLGSSVEEITMLERLAEIGAALDAPWLAEAPPDLAMGALADDAAASWAGLRARSSARYLGLALPRILLRLPYGKDTDRCERFDFEELERVDAHNSYLWGNPAVVCATLLAEGFSERGSGLATGVSSTIEGLPLHLVRRGGETTAKPCAELVMREDEAIALIEAGFIPMISYRDQDVVRVGRIQSVATPASRLAGRLAD